MNTSEQNGDTTPSPWAAPGDSPAEPISGDPAGQTARGGTAPGTAAPAGYDPGTSGQPPVPAYPPEPGYGGQYGGWPGYGGWPYPVVARSTNGMAIASLVLAVAGLAACGVPALVGAILGHVARRQIRRSGEEGDGLALAGIITGWAVFGLSVLAGLAYFGFVAYMMSHIPMNDGGFPTPEPFPS